MFRFMAVCFLFLGWAFWELSGGSDFEPAVVASTPESIEEGPLESDADVVTRNATAEPAALPVQTASTGTQPATPAASPEQVTLAAASAVDAAAAEIVAETTTQTAAAAPAPATALDLRAITGNRVNMRRGPGTDYGVVAKLSEGTEVEVLQDPGNGWLELRVTSDDTIGWIADWLVTSSNG